MNATHLAQKAYAASAAPIRTHRGTEYAAFSRITHKMHSAAGRGKAGFRELVEALHDNRRMWTVLAADVAASGNGLPDQVRAQILYLTEFTHLHTGKVLAKKASVAPLIEINAAVMRGLSGKGPDS